MAHVKMVDNAAEVTLRADEIKLIQEALDWFYNVCDRSDAEAIFDTFTILRDYME